MVFVVLILREMGQIERERSQLSRHSKRIPAVEGLRGLAMTLVFFGHFEGVFRRYLSADSFSLRLIDFLGVIAHQGVCIFLVLSGYFVYRAYLDRPEDLSRFVLRRVLRIYPPYLAMLCLYLLLSMLYPAAANIPAGGESAFRYVVANILLVASQPMVRVSWTIATLLALYTVVPWLWRAVRFEHWEPGYRVCFIVLATGVWFAVPHDLPMVEWRAGFFLVGFALHEARKAGATFAEKSALPGLMILACGYVLWYAAVQEWLGPELSRHWQIKYVFLCPGLFYLCGHVIAGCGRLSRWLQSAALPRLGRISYAYYLCHYLAIRVALEVVRVVRPGVWHSTLLFWAGAPVMYGCTLLVALVWYRVVEAHLAPSVLVSNQPVSVIRRVLPIS